jgi:hypothetical protein
VGVGWGGVGSFYCYVFFSFFSPWFHQFKALLVIWSFAAVIGSGRCLVCGFRSICVWQKKKKFSTVLCVYFSHHLYDIYISSIAALESLPAIFGGMGNGKWVINYFLLFMVIFI